jgi:hypothetical protein
MEMFTRESMEYLMSQLLEEVGVKGVVPSMWLRRINYKKVLQDRLFSIYKILLREYTQKRDNAMLSSELVAWYEGALCRILSELHEPITSVYSTVLPDSPKELRLAYQKGWNSHVEFGQSTVKYPSIVETHS